MEQNTFVIEDELKKLPAKPGVYLMHSDTDEIIYIGKAIRLKNRVRQYFQSDRNKSAKIRKMVSNIAWFEYIVTDSETEALMLECNLIKEYRPRYNTMLTDDKAYPFIRVTVDEPYPRVMTSRSMKKDKSRYFGPYASGLAVKDTLELLHRLFRIRSCSRVLPRDFGKERPCLNYHMGLCLAPCRGNVPEERYRENVERVIRFLNGDTKEIADGLRKQMEEASERMDYEEAMRCRDLIASVERIAEKQKMTDTRYQNDRDLIACATDGKEAVVQVFFMREGKLMGREHYHMGGVEDETKPEILSAFVKQYYAGTPFLPREVFLQEEIADLDAVSAGLTEKKGRKVSLIVPKKGEKNRLMLLAEQNASTVLARDKDKIRREEARSVGAARELADLLGIPEIVRIEAYDISNISGFESVGSMVVFERGKQKKNDYRKFRIRTVTGPDDYASMTEVLGRRLRHLLETEMKDSFSVFPDVILMDGGKGQVHAAEKVLSELGLTIPVAGMVKDDRHNTRGLYFRDEEVPIDRRSEAFHLITRVQDEAHRFAITYHRGLHTANSIRSVLREIPGVGEKREKALMRRFRDMDELRAASLEEIANVEGINRPAAEKIHAFLHEGEGEPAEQGEG